MILPRRCFFSLLPRSSSAHHPSPKRSPQVCTNYWLLASTVTCFSARSPPRSRCAPIGWCSKRGAGRGLCVRSSVVPLAQPSHVHKFLHPIFPYVTAHFYLTALIETSANLSAARSAAGMPAAGMSACVLFIRLRDEVDTGALKSLLEFIYAERFREEASLTLSFLTCHTLHFSH